MSLSHRGGVWSWRSDRVCSVCGEELADLEAKQRHVRIRHVEEDSHA